MKKPTTIKPVEFDGRVLHLTTRAANAIRDSKCQTIDELMDGWPRKILCQKNSGKVTVGEIEMELRRVAKGDPVSAEQIKEAITMLRIHGYTVIPPGQKKNLK